MRFATTVLFILTILTPAAGAQEVWKFTTAENPSTPKEVEEQAHIQAATEARIEWALNRYKDVPEIGEYLEQFGGDVRVSMFLAGIGVGAATVSHTIGDTPPALGVPEIVLYGEDAIGHPMIRGRASFYHSPWGALVNAAIEWADERWFDSTVLHELYHYQKNRNATQRRVGDAWVAEELVGNRVQRTILSMATGGEYQKQLEEVVKGFGEVANLREFLTKIGWDEHQQLDSLFTPAKPDTHESGIRLGQYNLDLSITWINRTRSVLERQRLSMEAYRMLSGSQTARRR